MSCVWPSVLVVTNFPTEAHFGQHVWCQNLISASRGAKVAGDVDQLSFSGVGYGTPHHHTSSAEIVDLKDAVPCEPLIPTSLDTCTAISFLQHESWFIAEPDSPPVLQVPAPYFVAPSDRCKLMPTSQYCVKVRTFSRRPFLTVCADIPQRPETFDAVSLAVTVRFLRWSTRM